MNMKMRLVAFAIGVCSFLAVAAPVSAGARPAPPTGLPPLNLCLDLLIIRLWPLSKDSGRFVTRRLPT